MHVAIITFQLRQPYAAETHPGIHRLLSSGRHAPLGVNSFIFVSEMTLAQVCDQLRPHLVSGEHVFVFGAGRYFSYAADSAVAAAVEHLLPGVRADRREVPPP